MVRRGKGQWGNPLSDVNSPRPSLSLGGEARSPEMRMTTVKIMIPMIPSYPVSGLEVGHGGLRAAARGEGGEGQLVLTGQPDHKYQCH